MNILPITLDTIGTLMIAFAALKVHHRVLNEHKIDKEVFSSMRREQVIGLLGVFFILAGFIFHILLLV